MPYKVFFVEDEDVTREGIRDTVDWRANGFEFCGEASDGEMALPLLQAANPDVLITDIKMPFVDGLQLSSFVRERMPWVKIVILSGHDEFAYAQRAIRLGVAEYLLKPITVRTVHQVLQKLGAQLDEERREQGQMRRLQTQMDENVAALRERLLLKLVVGAIPAAEAIEKSASLKLDLVARYYAVTVVKLDPGDPAGSLDFVEHQRIQSVVAELVAHNPDAYVIQKDWDEMVLVLKGNAPELLVEEREVFLDQASRHLAATGYRLIVGVGSCRSRLAELCESFVEALIALQRGSIGLPQRVVAVPKHELLRLDQEAIEAFLRSGDADQAGAFFDRHLRPQSETALRSPLLKNYICVGLIAAAARVIQEWGGDEAEVVPELDTLEATLTAITSVAELRRTALQILTRVLAFREANGRRQHVRLIQQAKAHIDGHYADPDLSLNTVAALVGLSPSHFSVVFGQAMGKTFRDYLTEVRIQRAKEFLRSTTLTVNDIAYRVGYSAPHYFSHVFRKVTGATPTEFRE
ncbi:MAG TPA: response regulator [Anaerolineales bacterium]|nr:response regulator [Anaerolineales bacterium]